MADLENIVYDFITFEARQREQQLKMPRLEVNKEEMMGVPKLDRKKAEEKPLPQMIREYILHDRGNSIFLSDSFANLPSPVGEGQTIKNFFRFNEEEDNAKKLERENKERNEIKIEGKAEKKKEDKKPAKAINSRQLELDLAEIDRIVFTDNPSPRAEKADKQLRERIEEPPKAPYTDLQETQRIKLLIDQSVD